MGFTGIYLFLILKFFRKIRYGIKIIKCVAKCGPVMKQTKFVPWILAVLGIVIGVIFFYTESFAFSVGEVVVIDA